jgi:hypothetical protein
LIYLMFPTHLDWTVLRTRSDTADEISSSFYATRFYATSSL